MLGSARDRADQVVARARSQADGLLDRARADAAGALAAARETGKLQASALAAVERSRGRQNAQAIRLGAQREAYEEFRAQVRAAVTGLRYQPGYRLLRQRLTELAAALAGPGATITEDPGGGVVARGPDAIVDCSLPRLAEAAADALGPQVAGLWAPPRSGGT